MRSPAAGQSPRPGRHRPRRNGRHRPGGPLAQALGWRGPDEVTQQSYAEEVEASIAALMKLRTLGKKVTLKFCDHEPFWKVVVLGDHLWVQYCHSGVEVKDQPEYVFALNRDHPRLGLFVPFYVHFLDQWNDARHPHYDFDTRELVYTDQLGREVQRTRFAGAVPGAPKLSVRAGPAPVAEAFA